MKVMVFVLLFFSSITLGFDHKIKAENLLALIEKVKFSPKKFEFYDLRKKLIEQLIKGPAAFKRVFLKTIKYTIDDIDFIIDVSEDLDEIEQRKIIVNDIKERIEEFRNNTHLLNDYFKKIDEYNHKIMQLLDENEDEFLFSMRSFHEIKDQIIETIENESEIKKILFELFFDRYIPRFESLLVFFINQASETIADDCFQFILPMYLEVEYCMDILQKLNKDYKKVLNKVHSDESYWMLEGLGEDSYNTIRYARNTTMGVNSVKKYLKEIIEKT